MKVIQEWSKIIWTKMKPKSFLKLKRRNFLCLLVWFYIFLQTKIYSESDDESTKKGGLGEQVLGDQLKILEFLEMKHGWTTRGGSS